MQHCREHDQIETPAIPGLSGSDADVLVKGRSSPIRGEGGNVWSQRDLAVRYPIREGRQSTRGGRSRALLDHLVGASEDRSRDRQAERFRRPAVDDQIELGRLLNR